jgi:hypothetical protein
MALSFSVRKKVRGQLSAQGALSPLLLWFLVRDNLVGQ